MKYDTEETGLHYVMEHLSFEFSLAYSTPCCSSQILEDIGHLGDTQCAQEILKGSYAYHPDTDQWTMKILQEAYHTYNLFGNDSIDTTVSVYNFQDYWQGAKKRYPPCLAVSTLDITKLQVLIKFIRLAHCNVISMHQKRNAISLLGRRTDRTPGED
jgi:hypothetical protein